MQILLELSNREAVIIEMKIYTRNCIIHSLYLTSLNFPIQFPQSCFEWNAIFKVYFLPFFTAKWNKKMDGFFNEKRQKNSKYKELIFIHVVALCTPLY